jgi:quercetin dioxygenase-like cupin family protein
MKSDSIEEFKSTARDAGFDELVERVWKPNTTVDTHAHSFAVQALVTQGEMWLTCRGSTRHLKPGDTFALDRDEPHAERYGADGATYWAARRNRD